MAEEQLVKELIKHSIKAQAKHDDVELSNERLEELVEDYFELYDDEFNELLTTIKEDVATSELEFLNN